MDIERIKEKSIVEYLSAKGYQPHHYKAGIYWFHSPLKTGDETPSFAVYEKTNSYNDFSQGTGKGTGGNIISLVMKMEGCDFKSAINILENNVFVGSSSIEYVKQEKTAADSYFIIQKVEEVTNPWLIKYATGRDTKLNEKGEKIPFERGIPIEIVKKYCKQVTFITKRQIEEKNNNPEFEIKPRIAIGFVSDKGGYEFRSPFIKRCTTPKWISTIQGSYPEYDVFEGFFDFLTHLAYNNLSEPKNYTIVLNSLSMYKYAPTDMDYNLYLDNDAAANVLINNLTIPFKDHRHIYRGYKDYNDWYLRCILKVLE